MYRAFKLKRTHYSYHYNSIKVLKYRQAMVKFLTKNNNIPIISGKWQWSRPYHQRLGEESEILGDENLFLFLYKRLKSFEIKIHFLLFFNRTINE